MDEDEQGSEHPYDMIYCDNRSCRVNTFERGYDSACPGCREVGNTL